MTPRTLLASLAATLPLLCTPFALAQHQAFNINPDASTVAFTLASTHEITNGTFHVSKGLVNFDAASPNLSGLTDVTFVPQTYTGTLALNGDSTLQVTGIFTLHGTPHTLTVPMQLHIDGNKLTAKTTFKVPYVEWGLKDPSWFVFKVAKEVDVNLTLVGFLAP